MTKYEVRPATHEDIVAVISCTPEANLWGYMDETRIALLLQQETWTGLVDGEIVACGGLVQCWPGMAEAWIAITPLAKQHVSFLYRHVLAFLRVAADTYKLRRIQAVVHEDFEAARRFACKLGFKVDAFLEKYGPNGEMFVLVSQVM